MSGKLSLTFRNDYAVIEGIETETIKLEDRHQQNCWVFKPKVTVKLGKSVKFDSAMALFDKVREEKRQAELKAEELTSAETSPETQVNSGPQHQTEEAKLQ